MALISEDSQAHVENDACDKGAEVAYENVILSKAKDLDSSARFAETSARRATPQNDKKASGAKVHSENFAKMGLDKQISL